MFYNQLIQAFLEDESLFTDVKGIVDCPLKVDAAELIQACRERQPKDLLELLDAPGSDLEQPPLAIPPSISNGRNNFLMTFSERPVKKLERRMTVEANQITSEPSTFGGYRRNRRRGTAEGSGAVSTIELLQIQNDHNQLLGDSMSQESDMMIPESVREAVLQKYHLKLQNLGRELIRLWPKFYRQVATAWAPERNSLIQLPHPFIVPGGRFIEIYYWDSYWIILGLLSSGLTHVARDVLENFLFVVERYGFIPNGMRKYYLDRSQPPLLSCMLRVYYQATGDEEFIINALPLLEKEYSYWMREGHAVTLEYPDPDNDGRVITAQLNRYYSLEVTPRPESYRIDMITGNMYKELKGAADSLQEHFRAIRAAAESGWDFSSRWVRPAVEGQGESGLKPDRKVDKVLHKVCLVDIDTCYILPCDLNSFLFCVEEDLAYFAQLLGKTESYARYAAAKERRRKAMLHFLWDPDNEIWLDYDMKRQQLSRIISAASFVPLWASVNPNITDDASRIYFASRLSAIVRPYGIVCTNITAGLQWDSPNVWAPNHHMAVDFLCGGRFWNFHKRAEDDNGPAMALGINWASRYVNTVLDRFELFNTCSEKYDCYRLGKSGQDGEYVTQDGFGWTNGVVLDFLEKFGKRLTPQGLFSAKRPRQHFTIANDNF